MYICKFCSKKFKQIHNKCPKCNRWNSLVEKETAAIGDDDPEFLDDIQVGKVEKIASGDKELDYVFDGGYVPGAVYLISGEPGIGKSTLLAQICKNRSKHDELVYYFSAEESKEQVAARMKRLGVEGPVFLSGYNNFLEIEAAVATDGPALVVIDSISTISIGDGEKGSVASAKEIAARCGKMAEIMKIPVFIIAHITKDGGIAGPKALEHQVDAVLQFDSDRKSDLRILRSLKNRFGICPRMGIFRMTGKGLKAETPVPAARKLPGSVIGIAYESGRVIPCEIQCLMTVGNGVNQVIGYDMKRVKMIQAILAEHLGCKFDTKDMFLNIIGGIDFDDTGLDLPIATAIYSAYAKKPFEKSYFGELDLTGDVIKVKGEEERIENAKRFGYELEKVKNIGDI